MVGPPYFVAARLHGVAAAHWSRIDGECALNGVNLLDLPIDRYCNAVHSWMLAHMERPDEFEYRLMKPPPGVEVGEDVVQAEMNAVAALMGG